ncbi:hypothetical protein GOP47_0000645 [Adiantum capillus-veneris]|uniref:Uncharacterized protein n=1 Tax=Adiantum capillus-veneris TaxID=13818 RepID=A0A9D4ZSH8_ADICA|nr:hypothetical protein GOP47_0000645 [Adiantum capillus-veneris]
MDSSGLAAALQDGASSLYHNNITPFIQRCASYVAQQPPSSEPDLMQCLASKRALQHSDNLKWQQDMFHRLLHLLYLSKEGLASEQQLASSKSQVLTFLESMHPDGEWPEFTRDKLLFLQDLLFASCISENEYHASKKPLILRLADQGAILDAEDFIFDSSTANDAKMVKSKGIVRTSSTRRAKARSVADLDISRTPTGKTESDATIKPASPSPLKQVMGAVRRFNRTASGSGKASDGFMRLDKESTPPKVPHALDFLRPEHCPVREPPSPQQAFQQRTTESPASLNNQDVILPAMGVASSGDEHRDGDVCNWFMSPPSSPKCNLTPDVADPLLGQSSLMHSSKFPGGGTPSRLRTVLTGLMSKKIMQSDVEKSSKALVSQASKAHNTDGEEERSSPVVKGSKWGLDILRIPRKLQFEQEENVACIQKKTSCEAGNGISDRQIQTVESGGFESPFTKKHVKKVHPKGASSDFIIDKVLGENIKNELSRIRVEMNKGQTGQTFSNEQIDAIATKLPMDKADLKKFFPQTWCETYGDIVLNVVQKEFKEHVEEMQKIGKGRDKQHALASSPSIHNDENMQVPSPLEQYHQNKQHLLPRRKADFSKCFTTLDENSPVSNMESPMSPNVEKSKSKVLSQQRHVRRLTKDMTSLDHKLEEEILKMPLRQVNEYGSHLRA